MRQARGEDAAAIAALYAELVANPAVTVLSERLEELAADPRSALLVAEHDGVIRGTLLVSLCADPMFGRQPFAVLENLVVGAAARGQGLGAALMRTAEDFCRAADCSKIMLLSSASRSEAHRFFIRQGFAGELKRGFVKYRRHFAAGEENAC